jgi:predicted RNase H-like HicB family nuclease
MDHPIETGHEPDGRWVATMPQFPGWVAYGQSRKHALVRARKLYAILLNEGMCPDGRMLDFHPGWVPDSARPEVSI